MPNYKPYELNDPFGIDANTINPMIPRGEWIIMVHPKHKSKPLEWFTPKQIETLIRKQLAYIIHNVQTATDNGNDDTDGQ